MSKWFTLFVAPLTLLVAINVGCAKDEGDDLSRAQTCLDHVPESDPAQADSCMSYVEKYDSPAANVLKCSIKMTAGGLIETKVLKAYQALKDQNQSNQAAAFMTTLSLNVPTIDAGLAKAQEAQQYCGQSGQSGLVYIAAAILAGTAMNSTLSHLTGGTGSGTGVDINDPDSISAAVKNLTAKCSSVPMDPACAANLPALGAAVITISASYCGQSGADQTVCGQLQPAVTSAGGDPATVGKALYCYLQSKTYNASTQACQ